MEALAVSLIVLAGCVVILWADVVSAVIHYGRR